MKPEVNSKTLLAITRSKAKMYEYDVPLTHHIKMPKNPSNLFGLTIGILGDAAVKIWTEQSSDDEINELLENLKFSAFFIDAYVQSRLDTELDNYFIVIGSASYYLSDLQGSSKILADRIPDITIDLKCYGLERLLIWILKGNYQTRIEPTELLFGELINEISEKISSYYRSGIGYEDLASSLKKLRTLVYLHGTPRQLLFSDLICAVTKKHYLNSTWNCLPRYSEIPIENWKETLKKNSFIRNLWPAQHLIGSNGVYGGKSAVIQMPTSAGKTRAVELIIRSGFLSGRTNLAVIIAPFRALCNEIKNSLIREFKNESVSIDEISDLIQVDFKIEDFLSRNQVLIVTPEKLVYVLRQNPELAEKIGLIVYDEGHQFDTGKRGVTYELLLTTLNALVPTSSQKILISAVITNAKAVSEWLNPTDSKVIIGNEYSPTFRTIGFSSWKTPLGRLEFISPSDPDKGEFFVPRVIKSIELQLRRTERKIRQFPEKNNGSSIAVFLGLKLIKNGSVAIFCGTKAVASSLCERVLDAYDRGLDLLKPSDYSDREEVNRLYYLYQKHFNELSTVTKSAALGIYTHHRNTPHGIRLAIEHAMKNGLIKFVICTSTLAQGVNIPIRYLIVTSVYQGNKKMKVRDFHNLIGRVGRSGMHTEGSILFADSEIFDTRKTEDGNWRWSGIKEMLDPENSEPCGSSLLSILGPIWSDDKRNSLNVDMLEFAERYLNDVLVVENLSQELFDNYGSNGFSIQSLKDQIERKIEIISAIESYLLSYLEKDETAEVDNAEALAKSTFAYSLASEEWKDKLINLFKKLSANIQTNITGERKKAFGKTLLGIGEISEIEKIVVEHYQKIISTTSVQELFLEIWPLLYQFTKNTTFKKCTSVESLKKMALGWINGDTFYDLFLILKNDNTKLTWGTKTRAIKIEDIVDICEGGLSFDGMLIVGAICEICNLIDSENLIIINRFRSLQKIIKYGLKRDSEISFFELGFSDRVISKEMSENYPSAFSLADARFELLNDSEKAFRILVKYPSYYENILKNIIN